MSWTKWVLLMVLLLLAVAFPLARQLNQMQGGSIEGFVVDDKGVPLSGASVEARNTLHGLVNRNAVNANGFYRISNLAPGKYALWAEANGYSCQWIPQVLVQDGKQTRQDFRLTCEKGPQPEMSAVPIR